MARINLLPWRAERRKQREREFYTMLGMSAVAAIAVFLCASYWMSQRIDNQNDRNTYLQTEIKKLDEQIETVKNLERIRSDLLARKQIIEDLQSNRSQMVHMFEQLSRTIPEGVRLTSLKQTSEKLTLDGVAESNTRVATYMRSLQESPQFGKVELGKIENKEASQGGDPKMPYQFSLTVSTKVTDKDAGEDGEMAVDKGAVATADASTKAPSLGTQLGNAASQLNEKKNASDDTGKGKKP